MRVSRRSGIVILISLTLFLYLYFSLSVCCFRRSDCALPTMEPSAMRALCMLPHRPFRFSFSPSFVQHVSIGHSHSRSLFLIRLADMIRCLCIISKNIDPTRFLFYQFVLTQTIFLLPLGRIESKQPPEVRVFFLSLCMRACVSVFALFRRISAPITSRVSLRSSSIARWRAPSPPRTRRCKRRRRR